MNTLGPDPAVMAAIEKGNKVVFFDIEMGEIGKSTPLGRIKMELFVKEVIFSNEVFFIGIPFRYRLYSSTLHSFVLIIYSVQRHVKIFVNFVRGNIFLHLHQTRSGIRIPLSTESSKIS